MPFYEYICPQCQSQSKLLVKFEDSTNQYCTTCPLDLTGSSPRLDRLFPTPNLQGSYQVDSQGRVWKGTEGSNGKLP